jgi:hypothetical protein
VQPTFPPREFFTPRPATQQNTPTPTPEPAPVVTVTATPVPVVTATATPVATATSVATTAPTRTPTVVRTVAPTAAPTQAPTQAATQARTGAQVQGAYSGQYLSGSQRLTAGRATRVVVRYTVTNDSNEVMDLSHTVVFDLADGVTAASAVPTKGSATILPRQVSWGGFMLNPAESATIELTLDVTPSATAAGRTMLLITGVHITGVTASGGLIDQRGGGLTSGVLSGLANGGFVAALASVGINGGAPVLPNTGAGEQARRTSPWVLLIFAFIALAAIPQALVRRLTR